MRTRKKKWTAGELAENELIITEKPPLKDDTRLEIGCGKGGFVCAMAERFPDALFIAVERESSVVACAARKARESGITNVRFLNADALSLAEFLGGGEIGEIYLNFSDPWSRKKKWSKKRLTHRVFLDIYALILKAGGKIYFKTDDADLFDFSIAEFAERGWKLSEITRDLHSEPYAENLVKTEYEERFKALGKPILRLVAEKTRILNLPH